MLKVAELNSVVVACHMTTITHREENQRPQDFADGAALRSPE
jgi:hypothetical protein